MTRPRVQSAAPSGRSPTSPTLPLPSEPPPLYVFWSRPLVVLTILVGVLALDDGIASNRNASYRNASYISHAGGAFAGGAFAGGAFAGGAFAGGAFRGSDTFEACSHGGACLRSLGLLAHRVCAGRRRW